MIELKRSRDIEELMKWRGEVVENVFGNPASPQLLRANREYYEKHIPEESHLAYIALLDGREVGCGSICLSDELPSPDNSTGHCAYLMNIYVRKPFRSHGVGHSIVMKLLEEAKNLNCGKIYLETTEEGRSLYESLGFGDLPDMMKYKDYERN